MEQFNSYVRREAFFDRPTHRSYHQLNNVRAANSHAFNTELCRRDRQMVYGIDNIRFTDTAFNLALEEYCFRHLHPKADVFLLYANAPSVVIGRHQNPIEELDLEYAQQKGMQVIRRISGGGAVYHDHGNINYSLITSFQQDSLANIPRYLEPVVNALARLGIGAHIDSHNNICIDSQKISGTSQYSDTRRLLVHGTLLFDTDLWVLKRVLMPNRLHPFGLSFSKNVV